MTAHKKIYISSIFLLVLIGIFIWYKLLPPKVSIVMPVYNGVKYLDKTINFLLLQSYKDFELIAIDDGSTDGSYEKLLELAQIDNRIRIYKNDENMGITKTRNKGFLLARGKYIAPMDQDDWSLPDRLDLSVKYLDEHSDITIVDVGTILMKSYYKGIKDERMGVITWLLDGFSNEAKHFNADERNENIKLSLLFSLAVPTQSAALMRKSWFIENNVKYTEGILYADDYYLYADMLKKGAKFHHIEEIQHIYNDVRKHDNQFNKKQYDEVINLKKDLFAEIGLNYDKYVYLNDEPQKYMCKLFEELLSIENKDLHFSRELLKKNKSIICDKSNSIN